MSLKMRLHDDNGRLLDADIVLEDDVAETRIVFESKGPGRNVDYVAAFDLVLQRLAKLRAVIMEAAVVSDDTRDLSLEARRLAVRGRSFPIQLTAADLDFSLARSLRRAAALVGRRPAASGGDNPTKRVELRFRVPERGDRASAWLAERLFGPSTWVEQLVVEEYIRPRSRSKSQGFGLDAEARRIVDRYAMERAIQYFSGLEVGEVRDVAANRSYDLECTRHGREFHVEVKGTTGLGNVILLTSNEVRHAQDMFPNVVLFVVSEIILSTRDGARVASGGIETCFDPWAIDFDLLKPQNYTLVIKK